MSLKSFLKYYQEELDFLIEGGESLSQQHPNIAKHLDFSANNVYDPDVKKLIESVAFLNAKLHKKLDENSEQLNKEILNTIYPQFNQKIPSFAIMQFKNGNEKKYPKKEIPKDTKLSYFDTNFKETYYFKTTSSVEISPYFIKNIKLINTNDLPFEIYSKLDQAIEIEFEKNGSYESNEIIIYINMLEETAFKLYEAIFTASIDDNLPVFEEKEEIGGIFNLKNNILPKIKNQNAGFKTLLEFNSFKESFLFFKIKLNKTFKNKIIIPINSKYNFFFKPNSFLLNCATCINLFEKNSEPILINNKTLNYDIIADYKNSNTLIHSIKKIEDTSFEKKHIYKNFLHSSHIFEEKEVTYWQEKRFFHENLKKEEVKISLINNINEEEKVLFAKLECIQKNASIAIEREQKWVIENNPGNIECINLNKPTAVIDEPFQKEASWRLISHFSINYNNIDSDTLNNIKELFKIYNFKTNDKFNPLIDIKRIENELFMDYFENYILPKNKITIFVGSNSYEKFIICEIIAKFLSAMVSLNTKLEILIKNESGKEIIKKWKII